MTDYIFKPIEDITAFELALALPVLLSGSLVLYDNLPDNVKRHFELEKRND